MPRSAFPRIRQSPTAAFGLQLFNVDIEIAGRIQVGEQRAERVEGEAGAYLAFRGVRFEEAFIEQGAQEGAGAPLGQPGNPGCFAAFDFAMDEGAHEEFVRFASLDVETDAGEVGVVSENGK